MKEGGGRWLAQSVVFSELLGLPLSVVETHLKGLNSQYVVELTEPTRQLGSPGQLRVINIHQSQGSVLVLTCAREFI